MHPLIARVGFHFFIFFYGEQKRNGNEGSEWSAAWLARVVLSDCCGCDFSNECNILEQTLVRARFLARMLLLQETKNGRMGKEVEGEKKMRDAVKKTF